MKARFYLNIYCLQKVVSTKEVIIQKINQLNLQDIAHLVAESSDEGFRHLNRLVEEYNTGVNRFDKQGEALFVACIKNHVVGICGLNQDPYSENPYTGRVRHLYVAKDSRRVSVGQKLMKRVIQEAIKHFQVVVLKTDNPIADRFYRSLGFSVKQDSKQLSHYLKLF